MLGKIFKGKNTVSFYDNPPNSEFDTSWSSNVPEFIKDKCENAKVIESHVGSDHDDARYHDTRTVEFDIEGALVRCHISFDHDNVCDSTYINYTLHLICY